MASAPCPTVNKNNKFFDPSSYANASCFAITHMDISLTVNFDKETLAGNVDLTVKKNDGGNILVLDTNKLTIHRIRGKAVNHSFVDLDYSIGLAHPIFGSPLTVNLPEQLYSSDCFVVSIDYETSPEATALQWLKPSQTRGKKHPYLFSQCQAIHCRSVIPCQDSPSVKQTYSAKIKVPAGLQALMSANELIVKEDFFFKQTIPISSYLIALAVGNIKQKELSERSKVWCEPEELEAAAKEFEDVEKLLKTAESIMGPYVWGRYDLLVLPPSFPYGGMENPCLTFVTPTLVAGDRSLVNVIAHEITHSWSGNLFTNKNWGHFWLNEGHTRFIEGKIVTRLYGEQYGKLFNENGYKSLCDQVEAFGEDNKFTQLVLDMKGVDPDECYSIVPYEKGAAFLQYLEKFMGEKIMLEFLRALVEKYKYDSLDSDEYVRFLKEFCNQKDPAVAALLNKVDWDNWLHGKGLPKQFVPEPPGQLEKNVEAAYEQWSSQTPPTNPVDIKSMFPLQIQDFLDRLIRKAPLSETIMDKLSEVYDFVHWKNYEIKYRWLVLGAKSHYKPCLEPCLDFLKVVGRMKYVKPIYTALAEWPEARPLALKNFEESKDSMHSVTAMVVSRIFSE